MFEVVAEEIEFLRNIEWEASKVSVGVWRVFAASAVVVGVRLSA